MKGFRGEGVRKFGGLANWEDRSSRQLASGMDLDMGRRIKDAT